MAIPISQQYAIGIDIGGTNTKFGLVNHRGDIYLPRRHTNA